MTYRRTESSTPTFADFNGATYTSPSNHWYQARRITDNVNLQVHSEWTPDLRTDAALAYVRYNGTAAPAGAPFPEVYINGVLALRTSGYTSGYEAFPLTAAGKAALKPGKNLIAIHCHQTGGGQYIDFGLVDVAAK